MPPTVLNGIPPQEILNNEARNHIHEDNNEDALDNGGNDDNAGFVDLDNGVDGNADIVEPVENVALDPVEDPAEVIDGDVDHIADADDVEVAAPAVVADAVEPVNDPALPGNELDLGADNNQIIIEEGANLNVPDVPSVSFLWIRFQVLFLFLVTRAILER